MLVDGQGLRRSRLLAVLLASGSMALACGAGEERACDRLRVLAAAQGERDDFERERCLHRMERRRAKLGGRGFRRHVRCLERARNLDQAAAC